MQLPAVRGGPALRLVCSITHNKTHRTHKTHSRLRREVDLLSRKIASLKRRAAAAGAEGGGSGDEGEEGALGLLAGGCSHSAGSLAFTFVRISALLAVSVSACLQ